MAQKKTIRSFTLYFTDQHELENSMILATQWETDYDLVYNEIADGQFAIVEFWWDDVTTDRIDQFLEELSKMD